MYKRQQRGFNRKRFQTPCAVVNLKHLVKLDSDKVDLESLKNAGLIRSNAKSVKLLAAGDVDKAFKVSVNFISTAAKEKIESAGGNIVE